jgi:hypothetical protein
MTRCGLNGGINVVVNRLHRTSATSRGYFDAIEEYTACPISLIRMVPVLKSPRFPVINRHPDIRSTAVGGFVDLSIRPATNRQDGSKHASYRLYRIWSYGAKKSRGILSESGRDFREEEHMCNSSKCGQLLKMLGPIPKYKLEENKSSPKNQSGLGLQARENWPYCRRDRDHTHVPTHVPPGLKSPWFTAVYFPTTQSAEILHSVHYHNHNPHPRVRVSRAFWRTHSDDGPRTRSLATRRAASLAHPSLLIPSGAHLVAPDRTVVPTCMCPIAYLDGQ